MERAGSDTPTSQRRVPGFREAPLSELPPETVHEVYERLLRPAFRREELLTLEELRSAYGPDGQDPSVVALRDGAPEAVMLGEWYADGQVLLLAYLAVAPAGRGTGVGTRLVREVLPVWHREVLNALVLAEVDDPRYWPGGAYEGDPRARLRFYERHGARLVPIDYFQPSLRPGSDRVEGMLLIRLDTSAGQPPGLLAAFLSEYFSVCEGPTVLGDPAVAALLSAAADVDLDDGMWPLSRWRELRQPPVD